MFWTILVYVVVATVVAIWLGRPLIQLSFDNEKLNAAFRYALVRLRDAAEAVGFYRGERVERVQLWRRFTPIIDNYRKFVRRTIIFNGWNWSVSQAIVPLPWVLQAPRLFAGRIDFGDVGQSATAFRTRCPSSVTTTTLSRPFARRSSGCTGWWTPTLRAARCRPFWSNQAKRRLLSFAVSKCALRTETSWWTRLMSSSSRATPW
jgi:hypothetical protein